MTLDTLFSSNDLLNFIICVSNTRHHDFSNLLLDTTTLKPQIHHHHHQQSQVRKQNLKNRKRRKPRAEAESQRMTHIAVERNRRKQMNHHLSVLRSLMPQSYVQRGDQASIVGGAIEFVKELEQLLQSLEAQKLQLQQGTLGSGYSNEDAKIAECSNKLLITPPFSQFFMCPQYTWSQMPPPNKSPSSEPKPAIADIEVTLIETHANLRILSRRSPSHLSKLISGFQSLFLTILHINVTTMDLLVLYSISAKLEERCQLTCVDDIAAAVHHMLRIIEGGAVLC